MRNFRQYGTANAKYLPVNGLVFTWQTAMVGPAGVLMPSVPVVGFIENQKSKGTSYLK